MNKKETVKILGYLRANYTLNPGTNADMVVAVWHDTFKEIDYETVYEAVKEFTIKDRNHNFNQFPGVGQIIGIISDWHKSTLESSEEAWKKVMRSAGNGRNYSKEEFQKLPENIQNALGVSSVLRELADANSYEVQKIKHEFIEKYNKQLDKTALNMTTTGVPLLNNSNSENKLLNN